MLGTCGRTLQQLQLGLESEEERSCWEPGPQAQCYPPPLGRFLGVDLGTWPSLAGRGLTHVNKLSSKFRIRA